MSLSGVVIRIATNNNGKRNNMSRTIRTIAGEFDEERAKRWKKEYDEAVASGKKQDETFMFDGYPVMLEFAKYMIEFLENEGLLPKTKK